MHLWDTTNSIIGSWWNDWEDFTGEKLQLSEKIIDVNYIKNIYDPKKLLVEKNKSVDDKNYDYHPSLRANLAVKNVLESHKKAYELIDNPDSYDKIFCTRLDIKYESKLQLEELENEYLLYPEFPRLDAVDLVSDLWLIGNPEQIKTKINIVNSIDDLWYSKSDFNSIPFEKIVTDYLISNNIKYKHSNLKYSVPRIF
jgi:hypothetical protein